MLIMKKQIINKNRLGEGSTLTNMKISLVKKKINFSQETPLYYNISPPFVALWPQNHNEVPIK